MGVSVNKHSICAALLTLLGACGGAADPGQVNSPAPTIAPIPNPTPNPTPTPPLTQRYTLTIAKTGSGTIASAPSGIDCGASCSASFSVGTSLTLTAAAAAGATFVGWSGSGIACAGSGPCTLALNASNTISALFSTPSPGSSNYNCADAKVRCVAQTAGASQEYATIALAAAAAKPGDIVLVHSGNYAGFTVTTSGTAAQPIQFIANSNDVIIGKAGNTESDAIHLRNVSYIGIEGFTIRNDASSSPRIHRCIAARGATPGQPMRGNTLRNNRCIAAEAEGFYLSQFADSLVETNTISGSGTSGQTRAHGVYLANAGSNGTTIRGNTIFGNANGESNGIHANGDLSVGGSGLIRNIVVEGNIVYGNGQSGINMDGVQDSLFQNNLIYGNARHAIRAYMIDGAAGPANLHFVNNSLVASGGWAIKLSEDSGGHVVFNNLLFGSTGSLCVGANSLASNNNVAGGSFSNDTEASVITIATWRSRTGQDANSQSSTQAAVFKNTAAADYSLSNTSPARDKGVATFSSVAAPQKDILGAPRAQGIAIDAGAYELMP
ncbi:MAG: right-handed parallel beta-helix repeat-containing protein [Burkholderiaceae bacterium]